MFIIYDLIFLLISFAYLPAYLFRRKFHRGFWQRMGFLPKGLNLDRPIWVHAVSVGETVSIRGLVTELSTVYPNKQFIFSTVTPTGNKIAQGLAREGDRVIYLPLDFSWVVKKVIARVNPELFIIAETEIWPNLITRLWKSNIPVIVVNARISDRSFRGYQAISFLLKPVFKKISLFCAQTKLDKERLLKLGVAEEQIEVTGNMKFDIAQKTQSRNYDPSPDRMKLGLGDDNRLFVAGSTHPGEEEIILAAYKKLLVDFPGLRLLIAPRHPERAKDVAARASAYGFNPVLISKGATQCNSCIPKSVFIVDIIGKLIDFYALADIVFVGGSLIKKGGQNILEPASLAKPILFGPQMFNFREIADLFLDNHACVLVHDEQSIKQAVSDLLSNPAEMTALGIKAQSLIANNQGATTRNSELIRNYAKKD